MVKWVKKDGAGQKQKFPLGSKGHHNILLFVCVEVN